mmetsp:Transcript_43494/g.128701  ORF Transcript_43494/g.128701 Transcript_43494/m.128701 type:complete len:249 (-) Transcript_43494:632-1378(-)
METGVAPLRGHGGAECRPVLLGDHHGDRHPARLPHVAGHGPLLGGHEPAAPDAGGVVRLGELPHDLLARRARREAGGGHGVPAYPRAPHEPLPRQRPGGDQGQRVRPLRGPGHQRPGRRDPPLPPRVQAGAQVQPGRGAPPHDPGPGHAGPGRRRAQDRAPDPLPRLPDALPRPREPAQRHEDQEHPLPLPLRAAHRLPAGAPHDLDPLHAVDRPRGSLVGLRGLLPLGDVPLFPEPHGVGARDAVRA